MLSQHPSQEGNHVDVNDLPDTSRRHADVQVLYTRAAEKGERRAALRTAVEHLQRNETEKATLGKLQSVRVYKQVNS